MTDEEADATIEAACAVQKARGSTHPDDILGWLEVARAWEERIKPEQPDPPDGWVKFNPDEQEKYRITMRIAEDGRAFVVCDVRYKTAVQGEHARTPGEAAQIAMELLDAAKAGQGQ